MLNNLFTYLKQFTWFVNGVIALLTFFIIKVFVFEFCVVNSADMANTMHRGDIVFVNKIVFGYEKEDVLYFEFPAKDSGDKKAFFMQRLIAEPGDTVMIMNKTIFTNDRIFNDPLSIKFNYILDTDTAKIDSLTRVRYNLYEGGSISKKGKYAYSLTPSQADSVKRLYFVKNMEMRTEKENMYDERSFPYSRLYSWNADNFGKLYVPKKNDTLTLDTLNIKLYSKIITSYEKNKLVVKSDSIFINDEYTKYYKVKQDYYFVMGDNRDNAIDSRQWGFLPKSYIKGKVLGVLVHKNKQ